MFDLISILEFAKGQGAAQTVLLFMIWLQSRGMRREIHDLKGTLTNSMATVDNRFQNIEGRLTALENKGE